MRPVSFCEPDRRLWSAQIRGTLVGWLSYLLFLRHGLHETQAGLELTIAPVLCLRRQACAHCSCYLFSSRRSRSLVGCYKFMSLHTYNFSSYTWPNYFILFILVKLCACLYFERWGEVFGFLIASVPLVYFYLSRFFASDVNCPQNKNAVDLDWVTETQEHYSRRGVSLQAWRWGGGGGGPAAQAEAAVHLGWEVISQSLSIPVSCK